MSELANVKLSSIDPNPMRKLKRYPYNSTKIETLRRSIRDVGLWEGVIARKVGNRYQQAFGHHRIEAARREKGDDFRVALIVRDLSDEQMLGFMGRENLEDYNADFLCMLETWEAATEFRRARGEKTQRIEIARVLGWVGNNGSANRTAEACDQASNLIEASHLERSDLRDLTVSDVRELAGRTEARIKELKQVTEQRGINTSRAQERVGGAARDVAEQIRKGNVAPKEIRLAVDESAFKNARGRTKALLFDAFGRSVADRIHKFIRDDDLSDKLQSISNALPDITEEEDRATVRRIDYELAELGEHRTLNWRKELTTKRNVVPFLKLAKEA